MILQGDIVSSMLGPDHPTHLELDILRSFGWAVIELESILFERFINLSSSYSLMTQEDFRKELISMESKGQLSSQYIHGRRAYRNLVVSKEVLERIVPTNPYEEIRLLLAGRRIRRAEKIRTRLRTSGSKIEKELPVGDISTAPVEIEMNLPNRMNEDVLRESELTSELILDAIEQILNRRNPSSVKDHHQIAIHIETMRKLLARSDSLFFTYIESEIPELESQLRRIIIDSGTDYLMLSLRLIDSKVRKYL